MKRLLVFAMALGVWTSIAGANLLINGDFEQPLDVGWTDSVYNLAGTFQFEQADTLGCGSGSAARVQKYLASYASLAQAVTVTSTNLTLSFDARFRIGGGSSTCWPVASMFVRYMDNSGAELGTSKMVLHNEYCTWTNNDTAHLVEIATPEMWQRYTLDIGQEMACLPGIEPSQVKQVVVQIFAYDNGT